MKVKRQKHVRKLLNFYKTNFGIQPPYNVLLDGTFCRAALKFKVNINEQLPKYLDAEVNILTTKCVLAECEAFGTLLYGPLKILRQFTCINCGHDPAESATTCMKKQAKKKYRKYILGTQDRELSEMIRKMTGIPLLFMAHNAISLESPSDASKQASDKALDKRLTAYQEQNKMIALKKAVFGETEHKKRKRKGPKGPNSLSCKTKKTKKAQAVPVVNSDTKKRNRKRLKKM